MKASSRSHKKKQPPKVRLGKSKIHGLGVFALRVIKRGEVILDTLTHEVGFNHSCEPNLVLTSDYKVQLVVATKKIIRGEELTVFYVRDRDQLPKGMICNCPSCRQKEHDA